jgi:Tol biopolymer transport system component
MPLTVGARIGHYEVTGLLGAGGMGEVYRARDTRLDREVALKILPDVFAGDPERRARFAREAKTLAALNHPNVAQIYGVEESAATSALAMELVDGEDLSQRIMRGPIPYDEAITLGKQIAQALQAAHEQGIIHRDLKPANIKLRDDGTVKVLDFGLAKALDRLEGDGFSGRQEEDAKASSLQTITSPAMTMRGMILGTAAYMAPEQAKGKVVDKRADIWAFGCVLYEMLTGRRAFAGEDVSETLASVLRSDVEWTGVPLEARRLIRKCLDRDPRKRLHDIGDAWDLIDDGALQPAVNAGRRPWIGWALAGVFFASTVALALVHFGEAPALPAGARFQIQPPPKYSFETYLTLSPDGRRLAFTANDESGTAHLWVRDIESLEARLLPGTAGAASPFWSPDGRMLGFASGSSLKKIDVAGGPPQAIADAPGNVGVGSWSRDNVIVFGTRGGTGGIRRVSATGGTPVELTTVDQARGESLHAVPYFLPDGRRFLYFASSPRPESEGIYVGSIDDSPGSRPERLVATTLGPAQIGTDASGTNLFFVRGGTLMAQRFNPDSLQLTGETATVAERVGSVGSFAFFSVAANVLAYRAGASTAANESQLHWVGRNGEPLGNVGEPLVLSPAANTIAISPNGRQAAIMVMPATTPDLWVIEFTRAIATRVTFHAAPDTNPVWSPDGVRLAFRSSRGNPGDIFEKDFNTTSEETVLLASPATDTPTGWSPDGRFLLFARLTAANATDLWALPAKDRQPVPLLETPFTEQGGRISPDGRWMAYVSNESGEDEVYLRPFIVSPDGKPTVGPKWRVSTDGGLVARWRGDGKELFYRDRSGAIVAVDVIPRGAEVETSVPRRLFMPTAGTTTFDVAADGRRFLLSTLASMQTTSPDPVTVVLNWQAAPGSAQGSRSNQP